MVLAAVTPMRSFANRERRPPRAGRIRPAPPGRADRNNRVDLSPYYPVFGRRMVMIAYARRPGTRRKPPAGHRLEPPVGPRATPQSLPCPRLVRLCPVKNHVTAVPRHAPGIRLLTARPRRGSNVRPHGRRRPGPARAPSQWSVSACGAALRAPNAPPADLPIAQSTCSISVDFAITRNTPEADRLLSVSAEDSTPYGGQIPSTNWILVTPGTVGLAGQEKRAERQCQPFGA